MSVVPLQSRTHVQSAIARASARTGVDFNYLLGQAQVESGLRADARAPTSSASGLYQFIEQSWLGVVKAHGAEHGMAWAADSIRQTSGGRYVVSDAATRRAILDLRNDPQASSLMAAEHASDNRDALEGALGRSVGGADLYMAHFLGLGGARQFLSAMAANPDRPGAAMFPSAARANRNVFFGEGGQPRSLGDIYQRFAAKLDRGAQVSGGTAFAATPAMQPAVARFALGTEGEVVMGNAADDGDRAWLTTTLANLNVVRGASPRAAEPSLYRPTPESARLAYSILAQLGMPA